MSNRAINLSAGNQVFLATEPILNRNARILGYQIHVGDAFGAHDVGSRDADDASRLAADLDVDGFSLLRRGHAAFVGVTRRGLHAVPASLDPQHTIIDIPSTVDADDDLVAACAGLCDRGYDLSISGFFIDAPATKLLPYASYVKIDAGGADPDDRRTRTLTTLKPQVRAVVGTGVHTVEQMETAATGGFEYFQGFVVSVPRTASGREFSPGQAGLLQLLRALNDPNLSIHHLEDLVKHDPALCYRILQTVNSAAFALRTTVMSVGQAILLLGRDTIRRWATLWTMAGLGADSHDEVVVMSAVRARLCETLVAAARGPQAGGQAFLLGMCSMFDAILGRPMAEIVAELPLDEPSVRVLSGGSGPLRDVLDCVIAYERGRWHQAADLARQAGLDARLLPAAFMEALRWSRELNEISFQIAMRH